MPYPPRVMAEKVGVLLEGIYRYVFLEDLTALKIILTSLGIGQQ
ncbi:hypothetical protein NRS6131_14500 [Bacillus subtilis]|nr:hypothetical protein NRS6131_14500 [Bacillus subtilis]